MLKLRKSLRRGHREIETKMLYFITLIIFIIIDSYSLFLLLTIYTMIVVYRHKLHTLLCKII